MPQPGEQNEIPELTPDLVHQCLAPALNLCRGIELDIIGHMHCPFADAARKSTNGIMKLMEIVKHRAAAAKEL
ncbi:MAG TPA: hypothetical protein PKC25_04885 [Candidatus Rifleibacterium sp.]|nr:hypothetical protein [Candidatus Rifleibacterium sp.]